MTRRTRWLFEPLISELLYEIQDMTREQMANFLQKQWKENPILRRLSQTQGLQGQALHRGLINILHQFEALTRTTVQVVPIGTVQKLRGKGNLASLRSRPGFLQIEQQVFKNSQTLLNEVRHELAYYYSGGPNGVPRLTNTPFNALNLLEMMIQGDGRLPPPVAH
jgi:hypothetical protein